MMIKAGKYSTESQTNNNNNNLLSTYYLLGTVLSLLHTIFNLMDLCHFFLFFVMSEIIKLVSDGINI